MVSKSCYYNFGYSIVISKRFCFETFTRSIICVDTWVQGFGQHPDHLFKCHGRSRGVKTVDQRSISQARAVCANCCSKHQDMVTNV